MLVVGGPVTFKLLPRPRLQATEVGATADDGSVTLDAPVLKADPDIPLLMNKDKGGISPAAPRPTTPEQDAALDAMREQIRG